MSIANILLEDRDFNTFKFLWDFKVATTTMISAKFFGDPYREFGYRRLRMLEKAGFIQMICDGKSKKFLWSLDLRGFKVIWERLPPLREEGFKSESLNHDILLATAHLGKWLVNTPQNVTLVTEQHLRRVEYDYFPIHIPRTEMHVPDGYWIVPNGSEVKIIALEVELSDQRISRYEMVAEFYQQYKNVFRIIWLVPNLAKANQLDKIFATSTSSRATYHNFVTIPDFVSHNWNAKIQVGPDIGKTWEHVLTGRPSDDDTLSDTQWMLDPRKCGYKSAYCIKKHALAFSV